MLLDGLWCWPSRCLSGEGSQTFCAYLCASLGVASSNLSLASRRRHNRDALTPSMKDRRTYTTLPERLCSKAGKRCCNCWRPTSRLRISLLENLVYGSILGVARAGILRKCRWKKITPDQKRDDYLPVSSFDAIYLVDLCEPLLAVARQRFARKGWKNVYVICDDASRFTIPEWTSGQMDPRGSLSVITLSYSLSMVCMLIVQAHARSQAIFPSSTDATRSSTRSTASLESSTFTLPETPVSIRVYVSWESVIGSSLLRPLGQPTSACLGWLNGFGNAGSRWTTFTSTLRAEVSAVPVIAECVYRLSRIQDGYRQDLQWAKQLSQLLLRSDPLVGHPSSGKRHILTDSYIFLGCSRLRNVSHTTKIFEERAGNCVGQGQGGLMTPVSPFAKPSGGRELEMPPTLTLDAEDTELQETLHDVGAPKSPFHYQLRKVLQ